MSVCLGEQGLSLGLEGLHCVGAGSKTCRWLLESPDAAPLNGTFDLAMHAWHEPFDRILALAWERSISITTPQMGEAFNIAQPQRGEAWWLAVEGESDAVVQSA